VLHVVCQSQHVRHRLRKRTNLLLHAKSGLCVDNVPMAARGPLLSIYTTLQTGERQERCSPLAILPCSLSAALQDFFAGRFRFDTSHICTKLWTWQTKRLSWQCSLAGREGILGKLARRDRPTVIPRSLQQVLEIPLFWHKTKV
jgi:hypothetical protein